MRLARRVQLLLRCSFSRARREVEVGHVLVSGTVVTEPGALVGASDTVAHNPTSRTPAGGGDRSDPHPSSRRGRGRGRETGLGRDSPHVRPRDRIRWWLGWRPPSSGRLALSRAGRPPPRPRDLGRNGVRAQPPRRRAPPRPAQETPDGTPLPALAAETSASRPPSTAASVARGRAPGSAALGPGLGVRPAETSFEPIEQLGGATLVAATLATGRTHQVRVHLSYLGHPVLGDPVYGNPRLDPIPVPRLALHAAALGFVQPRTGEWMRFTSPLPPDLKRVVRALRQRLLRAIALPPAHPARPGTAAASPPPPRRRPHPLGDRGRPSQKAPAPRRRPARSPRPR